MQFHEEIYTSAAELLDSATGTNLGVVARSRGFPIALDRELAPHQGYTILDTVPLDHVERHPPRVVVSLRGTNRDTLCLTQVVFAGADHTGRTTPLAHHLLFNRREMAAEGLDPATLLMGASWLFRREWRQPPQWIDPPRSTVVSPASPLSLATWTRLFPALNLQTILPWAAEALMAPPATRRPVVLCIAPETGGEVAALLGELLSLVPQSIQYALTCVSHVVDASDYLRDAAVLFTYPSSPFLEQCQRRRDPQAPLVFDLVQGSLPAYSAGPYAAALSSQWDTDNRKSRIIENRDEWDKLGLQAGDFSAFGLVMQVRTALKGLSRPQDLEPAVAMIATLPNSGQISQRVDEWCRDAVATRVFAFAAPQQWVSLARIGNDTRWTRRAREAARQLVEQHAEETVTALVGATDEGDRAAQEDLGSIIKSRPELVVNIMDRAGRSSNGADIAMAATLLRLSSPVLAVALQWGEHVTGYGTLAKRQLLPLVLRSVSKGTSSVPSLAVIQAAVDGSECRSRFVSDICLPALHITLDAQSSAIPPSVTVLKLIELANTSGAVLTELEWLTSRHRALMTTEVAQMVLQSVRQTPCYEEAEMHLRRCGLLPEPTRRDDASRSVGSRTTAQSQGWKNRRPSGTRTPVRTSSLGAGEALQAGASVGPIRLSKYLAASCLVLAGIYYLLASVSFRHWIPGPVEWLVISCIAYSVTVEWAIRLSCRNPRHFHLARAGRWTLAMVLLVVLLGTGWVCWKVIQAKG